MLLENKDQWINDYFSPILILFTGLAWIGFHWRKVEEHNPD